MTNRLAQETSPYLQQHKENPVDWYPWGAEALAKASAEDKPIFLSIGYSACHWCHVMEHESFEDAAVADLLNRGFVPVKVDREERPDIDSIYMGAVQALTGQGGWPLNVFLTPDLKPFYGGTYWPPVDGMGLPAFPKVLEAIADAWANRREGLEENAEQVGTFLAAANTAEPKRDVLSLDVLDEAFEALEPAFDDLHGGFGSAPKFPQPPVLEFLLRTHKRKPSKSTARMITTTLDQMMQGGMYDQIGGGFHRYSVDRQWIVPHFEKMLYDNGQLARIYLDGFRLTGDEQYGRLAEDILDSLLGSMVDPSGGIWSAEDADTEGEEGKFYVWTTEEAREALAGTGVAVDAILDLYGITEGGNFEGHSIPTRAEPLETVAGRHGLTLDDLTMQAATARAALKDARAHRTKPGIDQKILASWNGLVLRSLAEVGRARKRPDFLAAANVLALSLREGSDNWNDLRHYTTYGQPGVPGYLEDYANVADGLLALYQATGDPNWLEGARLLIDDMLERFSGPENGLLFDSQEAHEPLVTRARDIQDGPTPSGNAVAAEVLIKASHLTGDRRHLERAEQILARLVRPMAEQPQGFGRALTALDTYLATPKEVVIAGPRDAESTAAMLDAVFAVYEPAAIVALAEPGGVVNLPLLESRTMRDGQVTGYVCERFACLPPTTDAEELQRMLVKGTGVSWSEL